MSSPLTSFTIFSTPTCAIADFHTAYLWALVLGFVLAFVLGFGMGANDVANAFGTSVGSKVLTLRNAFILATIMETLGAVLVGSSVTNAMQEMLKRRLYAEHPSQLLLGQLAILGGKIGGVGWTTSQGNWKDSLGTGGSAWLMTATLLRLPVSSTHSIVGAILGFTLVMNGLEGVSWKTVVKITLSWVLSPVLSGFVSASLYMIVDFAVLRRRNPVKCGLRALPVFYFFCIACNIFAVVYKGFERLGLPQLSFLVALSISAGLGVCAALLFHFVVRPRILAWISSSEDKKSVGDGTDTPPPSVEQNERPPNERRQPFKPIQQDFTYLALRGWAAWFFPRKDRLEDAQTLRMFSTIQATSSPHTQLLTPPAPLFVQVFTACFGGFAHGANDVSNSIAPLVTLLSVWSTNSVDEDELRTPIWLLFFGVFAICMGLWLLGDRGSGFTIEFGAAVTVLTASMLGLPISTTHCMVGSVVAVGTIKSGEGIDWHIFGSIAISWLVTLPVSAAVSAVLMYIMKLLLL
uniref:Phosphate transporter n=1 Tax=Globodera rostochiensis TaxID=31243 RepID=A0A914HKF5_GLORO